MKLLAAYDDDSTVVGRDNDGFSSGSSSGVSSSGSSGTDKVFRASDFFALSSYDTLEGSYLHHLFHSTTPESEKRKKSGGRGGSSSSSGSGDSNMPILPVAQLLERNTSRNNWMLVRQRTDTPSQYTYSQLLSRSHYHNAHASIFEVLLFSDTLFLFYSLYLPPLLFLL